MQFVIHPFTWITTRDKCTNHQQNWFQTRFFPGKEPFLHSSGFKNTWGKDRRRSS